MVHASVSHRVSKALGFWLIILGVAVSAILTLGRAHLEAQMFVSLSVIIAGIAMVIIPRAVKREPTLSPRFLWVALFAHIGGSLLRYVVIETVYHGVADANGYVGAGRLISEAFRSLNPPPLPEPGTEFMNWLTGLLFTFTGTTMLGGFVVCAALSFVGAWYFYRAFRIAFPGGNHKVFAALIFFIPSMWYWPSSLGKDAIIVWFLGMATYGVALLFRSVLIRGSVYSAFGIFGAMMIRPPIAAALVIAAGIGFVLRPSGGGSVQLRAMKWVVVIPFIALLGFFAMKTTQVYVGDKSVTEAYEATRTTEFDSGGGGGSNFVTPSAVTPPGFAYSVVTANIRPFPWEAGGGLAAAAALEGVLLAAIILWRRGAIWRGLKSWRTNGMVLVVWAAFLANSLILSTLGNFGLLARQRTQVLPFLFMLIALAPMRGKRHQAVMTPRAMAPTGARSA